MLRFLEDRVIFNSDGGAGTAWQKRKRFETVFRKTFEKHKMFYFSEVA